MTAPKPIAIVRTHSGTIAYQHMTTGGTVVDAEGDALDCSARRMDTRPLGGGGLRWLDWAMHVRTALVVATAVGLEGEA